MQHNVYMYSGHTKSYISRMENSQMGLSSSQNRVSSVCVVLLLLSPCCSTETSNTYNNHTSLILHQMSLVRFISSVFFVYVEDEQSQGDTVDEYTPCYKCVSKQLHERTSEILWDYTPIRTAMVTILLPLLSLLRVSLFSQLDRFFLWPSWF